MELMQQSSRNQRGDDGTQDSSISKLLREKTSIAASMKSINDVIRYDITLMRWWVVLLFILSLDFRLFPPAKHSRRGAP